MRLLPIAQVSSGVICKAEYEYLQKMAATHYLGQRNRCVTQLLSPSSRSSTILTTASRPIASALIFEGISQSEDGKRPQQLPDCLLYELFESLLPTPVLHQCAPVCRQWNQVVRRAAMFKCLTVKTMPNQL